MQFILDGEVVSYSKYRMMMDLRGNDEMCCKLDKFKDVLKIDVTFKDKPINALVVDMSGEGPIVQLMTNTRCKFDSSSNKWKDSYVRNLLNSREFISLFNVEFVEIVRAAIVHTENYTTQDMFWLLSHEEVGYQNTNGLFKSNKNTRRFDAFDGTRQSRIRKISSSPYVWWGRSAYLDKADCVFYVSYDGFVDFNYVGSYGVGCLPVCLIG